MKTVLAASLLFLMLTSCSGPVQPTATAVPIPTAAVVPTSTALPPSTTPDTQTVSEWNGIPIMPGAIAGEGDEEGYVFTIHSTPQEVQAYYQQELGKLGWQLSDQENSGSSLMLSFMDSSSAMVTVSVISNGEEVLVLLVK